MSIFIDKGTKVVVQGITGRDGSFHTQADDRVRHDGRGRRDAGEGRPEVRGHGPDLQHGARRRGSRPDANTSVIYVPPDVRGRRDHGSGGRRHRARRLHHRGRARARHDARLSVREGAGRAAARPQLPGPDHARRVEGRHHSRPHLRARDRRRRHPLRHAHLRGRLPAHPRRASARPPASASAAIRSTAPTSSTASRRSRTIRTRRPWR